MARYVLNCRFRFRVKDEPDAREVRWEQVVTIPDVARWTEEGNRTVAEELRDLTETVLARNPGYRGSAQVIVENGWINFVSKSEVLLLYLLMNC